ncbi:hypothetical protein, partial [Endozoicomonas sp. SESOKO3]|uniref:hypothetical protein n=2 Tax=unclassified Endozoicomonas TaxID=2644528 RepID=UPI0021498C1E
MTHARPHALNLAVAVAISSSIIGTQALAERRLQTKSIDIAGNGHTEFTQSEVMVQPTLGDDQQPIPKSFTTTYPDQAQATAGYNMPSEGFTDVLSGIAGGVSTVDLFETDDNDIAQKYTKVLKIGNEGVFRFTHNLAEKNLLIEVRFRMTQQDSIGAVRAQLGDTQTLEPFTEIACPEHLVGVLKGASEKAGNLGEVDHYVALATLKVDKVKVNGRTFMRLIAASVQPPQLHRLGQSLFVNDEALFAAATSAYTQVHILGKDLQQRALNDLLSYNKPVGYVVHVEDESQSYPVPAGYPKLEVTEAPGDIIVFRGQKQNPADLAFVEGFYKLWEEDDVNNPKPPVATQVKKDKVKGYHYVIRSKQMALLEEIAAKHDAQYGIDKLITLMYYESLKQALASAAPDQADEFEFTIRHIRVASSVVTPTLMHHQLVKNFSFKPTLTNLLNNRFFVWDIENTVSVVSGINLAQANALGDDERFTSKILGDVLRQLIEMENEQSKPEGEEGGDTVLNNQLKRVIASDKEKHRTLQQALHRVIQLHLQQQADEVVQPPVQNQQKKEEQKNGSSKRHHEVKRTPVPKQPVRNSRPVATRVQNAPGAVKLPAIEGPSGITPAHENDLDARFKTVQPHLPHKKELTDTVIHNYLADIEILLGLVPDNKKDPKVRHQAIKQHLKRQATRINQLRNEIVLTTEKATASEKEKLRALQLKQQIKDELLQVRKEKEELQNQSQILQQKIEQIPKLVQQVRDARADATKARNAQLAAELEINDWDDTQPPGEQARLIRQEIHKIKQLLPATEQLDEEAVKAKPATTGGKRSITLINENDMAALPFIPQPLQPNEELSDEEARERLAFFEGKLSLIPENKDDLEARHQHLQKCIKQQFFEVFRQDFQNQQDLAKRRKWLHPVQDEIDRIPMQRKGAHEALASRQGAAALEIDNRDDTQPSEKQARLIIEKVYEIKQPETVTPLTSTPVALTSIAPTSIASTPVALTSIAPTSIAPTSIAPTSIAPTSIASTPVAAISIAATTLTTKDSSTEQPQVEAVKETLANHDALLEATEEAVVLKPDSTDTYDDRLDALRKKQVQPGGDDGTGGKIRQMIQELARLESEIKTGPQHYDNEIHGMGKAAIHYVDHEQRDLKSFSEYFAKHSANGDRIIALLREGLISKIELE